VFDTVNIGAGKGSTIREVVHLILDAVGHRDVEILFDSTKPATIPFRIVDIGKARRELQFEPQISLEEGIKDTAEWYINTLARKSV
jgi:nucleoside-diphosphate-sugar epimerase